MRFPFLAFVVFAVAGAGVEAQQPTPKDRGFVDQLPRGWCGTFRWDSDQQNQRVTLAFERLEALPDGKIEAHGTGQVQTSRIVRFKAFAVIDPATRRIELFESAPDAKSDYVTDGSHVGELAADLQSMRLVWTTRGTGQKGSMELAARPSGSDLTQPCSFPPG